MSKAFTREPEGDAGDEGEDDIPALPPRTSGNEVIGESNIICTCPPSRSVRAGALPLYGTWTMSIPAMVLNNSPARCRGVPLPVEANMICPGWLLARAISSCTDFAGISGRTTRRKGA